MFVRKGKNTSAIYAKIKNGNVYKLNTPIAPARVNWAIAQIKTAGRIQLKHWTKCGGANAEGSEPRPVPVKPEPEHDLVWEAEMQGEGQMTCGSPMCDELKAQEADHSFWVRDTEGRPTQVNVRFGFLTAGGAA